jgi:hypothetical protein
MDYSHMEVQGVITTIIWMTDEWSNEYKCKSPICMEALMAGVGWWRCWWMSCGLLVSKSSSTYSFDGVKVYGGGTIVGLHCGCANEIGSWRWVSLPLNSLLDVGFVFLWSSVPNTPIPPLQNRFGSKPNGGSYGHLMTILVFVKVRELLYYLGIIFLCEIRLGRDLARWIRLDEGYNTMVLDP